MCLCACAGMQLPLRLRCVYVCVCAYVCLSGMMPPLVYCVTSVHTTGQLRAKQHFVYVCVMEGGGGGQLLEREKSKEEGLFVSRRRLTAGSR